MARTRFVPCYTICLSKPTVTLQPNWPVYRGEAVTLRCEIQGGGRTQWNYEWRPTNRNSPTSSEYKINSISESDSGEYRCKAKRGRQFTEWSDAFRLTVRCKCGIEVSFNINTFKTNGEEKTTPGFFKSDSDNTLKYKNKESFILKVNLYVIVKTKIIFIIFQKINVYIYM
uniref:Ig-like domain-containing protein n=1 Tax=Poecilia mexicana TaxID=48701 RepID=A0A3B3XLK0_9TELE